MKKKFSFLLVLAVLVMGLSACGSSKSDTTSETKATKAPKATETAEATKEPESKTTDTKGKHHAKIKVKDYGTIEVELDGDTAPITVANFIKLVNEKFYDGLTFHRIMSGFMIQGGDPLGNGTGGSDETIKGEFSSNGVENNISHKRGVISMARSSDPDSASSQFFIMHQDSTYLDGEYAAFGKVTKGMKVVDKICEDATPTDGNGTIEKADQPVIESIRMVD
ncbi:MAG: peptidylprolyl isomerase [Clostridium sp.]|jgi:peptidyl-prolyl cis-trans isomerase B (cyclophilin B)